MNSHGSSILIITYHMIPNSPQWGSCQRMYFLAEFLQKRGINVYVLHSAGKYYGNYGMGKNFHSIPIVERYPLSSSIHGTYTWQRRLLQLLFKCGKVLNDKINIAKLENIIFNEPHPFMGSTGYLFFRKAKKAALELVREKSIDCVIISAPPFSLFHFGPFLKKYEPGIKIIFDYRDPWNIPGKSGIIASVFERHLLEIPDYVVFVNERICSDTAKKFKVPAKKRRIILNGYSHDVWNEALNKRTAIYVSTSALEFEEIPKKMVISYIGAISLSEGGDRDLSNFLWAFKEFHKNKRVELRIVGAYPPGNSKKYRDILDDKIKIIPQVNLIDSLLFMMDSDVLLLIHGKTKNSNYILTGKFFDYIRSGKVILGISEGEAYFNEFIKKYKLGISCSSNPRILKATLELLYEKWMEGTLSDLRKNENLNIEEFSREYQNEKYLNLLLTSCGIRI